MRTHSFFDSTIHSVNIVEHILSDMVLGTQNRRRNVPWLQRMHCFILCIRYVFKESFLCAGYYAEYFITTILVIYLFNNIYSGPDLCQSLSWVQRRNGTKLDRFLVSWIIAVYWGKQTNKLEITTWFNFCNSSWPLSIWLPFYTEKSFSYQSEVGAKTSSNYKS